MRATLEPDGELDSACDRGMPLVWEFRVFVVALVGLIPGVQLGCIVGVVLANNVATFCCMAVLGGILGMIAGGAMEASS